MRVRGLKRRLAVAFAVLLPLGVFGVAQTFCNQLAISDKVTSGLEPQHRLQQLSASLSSAISAQHTTVTSCFDSSSAPVDWKRYRVNGIEIFRIIEEIFAASPNAKELTLINQARELYQDYENEAVRLFVSDWRAAVGKNPLKLLHAKAQELRDTLLELSRLQSDHSIEIGKRLATMANKSALLLIVLSLALLLVSTYFLVDYGRHVVAPIVRVKEAALRMAAGDLEQRLEIESEDEIGQLAFAFNRMSAAFRNLTEDLEKAARSATRDLHHSEEKYKSLLQRAQEGIIICDQNGFVLEVNRQARKLLGLVESQIYGQALATVLPAEGARVGGALKLAHRTGRRLRFLIEVPGSDDSTQSYEVSIGPVDLGEGRVVLLFLRDVTRQRKIEDQLVRSQRLKSVATLAGGLAHDYNNLLSPILGYASYLRTLPAPSPEYADKLRTIEEAARRAADLSQKLQSLARPRAPNYGATRQPVDLNEIVQFAAKLITPNLNPQVTTVLELAPEPLLVVSEVTELQQIVLNLAINANDAMPNGGKLKLATRREVRSNGDVWNLVTVSDTGIGMRPEVLPRIFDPFFTTKGAGKGCGLGLAMVHACVQRAEGRIQVDSEEGRGSTFRVLLPPAVLNAEAKTTKTVPEPLKLLRVLVVDDDSTVRETTRDMFKSWGCDVATCADGVAALEMLREGPLPDLAILDVRMNGMSGPEVLKQLRQFAPTLPVLFASGYPAAHFEGGVAAHDPYATFLHKPFSVDELEAAVRKCCALRSELSVPAPN